MHDAAFQADPGTRESISSSHAPGTQVMSPEARAKEVLLRKLDETRHFGERQALLKRLWKIRQHAATLGN